jgi:hypothetical protein
VPIGGLLEHGGVAKQTVFFAAGLRREKTHPARGIVLDKNKKRHGFLRNRVPFVFKVRGADR